MSRRRFVYGSVAVVGSAALLRGTQGRRTAVQVALGQVGFSQKQASGEVRGSGGLTLVLPKAASSQGTLLVATVLSPAASTRFTPPPGTAGSGWQLGKAVQCKGGRVEQWYWANNPGGLYGPHAKAGATFTGGRGELCLGGIAEFASPTGTTQILDTVGQNHGGGSAISMPVTSAAGIFGGSMAVFSQAGFFAHPVPSGNSWKLPAGYSGLAELHDGLICAWSHSCDGNLNAGNQAPTGGFSYTTGGIGWAAVVCCYRAVKVAPIAVVGGEPTNCLDLDPTGQQLVVGGDVEGCWRTANFGDNWQPADYGSILADGDQVCFADIKWSLLEPGAIYACTGKTGSGFGAFLASKDGGCTWEQRNVTNSRSVPLLFYGNGTSSPPRPGNENQDTDRAVNRLIAQDPAGHYLYLVTANNGVVRSADKGVTWTKIGLDHIYPRCIAINPADPSELWVGAWQKGSGQGGVWHTTNARDGAPAWSQLGGYRDTVADLKVVGSGSSAYLYAACAKNGIFRAPVSGGELASLNGSGKNHGGPSMNAIDTSGTSIWVTLDGYEESGDHQIIAGCSGGTKYTQHANHTNVVKLALGGTAASASYTDLTGSHEITLTKFPPFGTPWWHAGAAWQLWLGGSNSVNPHILVDPHNRQNIYVGNGGGFFRSQDGGKTWQLAVNGMAVIAMNSFAIDPNDGTHFVSCGNDYTSIDVSADPRGNRPHHIVATSPGASLGGHHRESHAVCFDQDSNVYVGLNTAYSKNAGGAVMYRASAASSPWHSTGYDKQVKGAPAVTGLVAGKDTAGRFVVAVAEGLGTFRWDGAHWAVCKEADGKPLPGSKGTLGQMTPMIAEKATGDLFCYDRLHGVYRSADAGKSWKQIWPKATADKRTGWLAVNPAVPGELWVSTDHGLYKLAGAGSAGGPVHATAVGSMFSGGAAGIAFSPGGTLFAIALPGAAPAPPATTLFISRDGGKTWTDWCGGDGSVGSYGQPAGQLGISSDGWLWAATGEHFGYWDRVSS